MFRTTLTKLLLSPVLTGRWALLGAIGAVAIPTAIRAAVNGSVTECEFTPYLPFVLLAAIMVGPWQAGAVALTSVAIVGGLFAGPLEHFLAMPCSIPAATIFLGSSAIIIAVVVLIRRAITGIQRRGADESAGGVVFSLEKGEVWASWYGSEAPMRLGSQKKVRAMMEDFLAQVELGKRLTGKPD